MRPRDGQLLAEHTCKTVEKQNLHIRLLCRNSAVSRGMARPHRLVTTVADLGCSSTLLFNESQHLSLCQRFVRRGMARPQTLSHYCLRQRVHSILLRRCWRSQTRSARTVEPLAQTPLIECIIVPGAECP